jgi:hypothetical protein
MNKNRAVLAARITLVVLLVAGYIVVMASLLAHQQVWSQALGFVLGAIGIWAIAYWCVTP